MRTTTATPAATRRRTCSSTLLRRPRSTRTRARLCLRASSRRCGSSTHRRRACCLAWLARLCRLCPPTSRPPCRPCCRASSKRLYEGRVPLSGVVVASFWASCGMEASRPGVGHAATRAMIDGAANAARRFSLRFSADRLDVEMAPPTEAASTSCPRVLREYVVARVFLVGVSGSVWMSRLFRRGSAGGNCAAGLRASVLQGIVVLALTCVLAEALV
mmetsp:Transcript_75692/g.208875  ORF Transcript_75692/g.208875 Transcript_75692/m.208875 type:complete len:217 (+) Transcript_75692:994-1644(+)